MHIFSWQCHPQEPEIPEGWHSRATACQLWHLEQITLAALSLVVHLSILCHLLSRLRMLSTCRNSFNFCKFLGDSHCCCPHFAAGETDAHSDVTHSNLYPQQSEGNRFGPRSCGSGACYKISAFLGI